MHTNGSLVDAGCKSKAVRIREICKHRLWPNIPRTTLLFSNLSTKKSYNQISLEQTGDIDIFNDSLGNFSKAVKPNYG